MKFLKRFFSNQSKSINQIKIEEEQNSVNSKIEIKNNQINISQNKIINELLKFGVTKEDFFKRKEELSNKSKVIDNDNDTFWSLCNELLIKSAYDYNKLRTIYYSMAIFLNQEGKDNFKLLQESARATLNQFSLSDLQINVEINGCSDSCDDCKKLNGKIISMDEAYSELPIPCKACSHSIGFCRCFYIAVPSRDSEGMLILKTN